MSGQKQSLLIGNDYIDIMKSERVNINKQAVVDLIRVKDEFDSIVESIELMSDKEFMDSYKKSRQQVKKREFVDVNEL